MRLLWKRLKATLRSEQMHREISDEMRFHLEMKADDLMRNGMPEQEAQAAAAQAFGRDGRMREEAYDVRGGGLVEELFHDVRFSLRLLRKQWVKTAVLVATLALGVGVNTAVFGVVNSVLLQPLAFPDAKELVVLHQANHGQAGGVSYRHFKDWRQGNHSFMNMAVYAATSATLTGQGDATIVYGAIGSASLFRVLDVKPLRGRLFTDDEDKFTGNGTALISDRLWKSRFGGSDDILGRNIHLDGRSFEIVGVIASRSAFPVQKDKVDYWTTVAVDANPAIYGGTIPTSRGYPRYDGVIARLKPGVTLAQAQQEMAMLAKAIARAHPKFTSSNEVAVVPEIDEVVGTRSRTMILILYGAVFCVLLVACLNVANILLVDALGRRREFSLRIALGSPVSKLVRQLMVESTIISLIGGAAGLLMAWLVLHVFVALAPEETPRLSDIHLSGDVFFYVIAVSLFSGLLFGCLPVLSTRQLDLGDALRENARGVTKRASLFQPGSVLICGQIILGMVLTCCAGVLVDNFSRILHSSRGFNPHGVLTASLSLPVAAYGQASPRVVAYYHSLTDEIRALPGVQAATLSEVLPLSGQTNSTTVSVVGDSEAGLPGTGLRFVEPGYFKTLQIPLAGGRAFAETDTAARPGCAIVNQAFVRRFLQGRDPYSSQLKLGWGGGGAKQIVGVVGDVRPSATSPKTEPEVYVPFAQFPMNDMSILVRTAGDPYALAAPIREMARKLDASVPLDRVRTLDDYLLLSSAQQQFMMWLLAAFAAATMLLSAIGLYAVLSDSVLARAHEFGIRLALGSSAGKIVALVTSRGLGVAFAGMVIGGVVSLFATRLLTRWLYENDASNAAVFAYSAGFVLLAALCACLVPAHRAATVDPVSLLRAS
jgi:putative ABC transport system permease protein